MKLIMTVSTEIITPILREFTDDTDLNEIKRKSKRSIFKISFYSYGSNAKKWLYLNKYKKL